MAWCFEDEVDLYAEQVLDQLEPDDWEAVVPVLWPLEVANVLLVAERKKRLNSAQSEEFLELINSLPITVEVGSLYAQPHDVITLGREFGLSAYDASYFELAQRRELPIATTDRKLRAAANRKGILFQPDRGRAKR